jgi:hypothetical protein
MSARDELLAELRELAKKPKTWPDYADALIEAGYRKPRTITTAEELDALPNGSVLIDSAGDVAQLRGGLWCGYETSPMSPSRQAKYIPATVLHEPDA